MTGTTPTSLSLTPRHIWSRTRGLLLAVAILITAGIVMALVRSGDQHGRLDPRSADPNGSRAVAELLDAQGVTTRVVTTLDEATTAGNADTTVLVTDPDLLTGHQQAALRSAMDAAGGRTVLVAPGRPSLDTLAPGVSADSRAPVETRTPQCTLPLAQRAGSAELGGERYATDLRDTDGCYLSDGLPTLLRIQGHADSDTVLLGAADILYNEHLAKEGNASLALQLLGSRPHLVWYLPSLSDPSAAEGGIGGEDGGRGGDTSFIDLVPSGWLWGTLQLTLAAVLAAIWRGRRLGPLVMERLPVAIRASESTEGRARLYRKTNARDRAATVLRTATRTRLAPLLGVPPTAAHSPDSLLPAVSARLAGAGDTTEFDLRTLLFGPVPTDDAALILLADQLDALEREVRTS
ncbi:DUF4350 domain-containing protein [Streptomyces sp. NRRL S-118]|uniref:DUF4350 domain-containing protein n=1 Tax=Streptomyces sp. NRRL S-118 TaxID=1463881 RepID=UPI0004C8AC0F|nr:DUF4350 domain-containing protein [Streptomyces sp. NRRL S-118]